MDRKAFDEEGVNPVQANPSSDLTERRSSRSWTVRASGLLLLLQAAGFVALCIYLLLPFDWYSVTMSPGQVDALSVSIILIPAAILAFLSAIGFLFLFRAGWLLAMAVQGATLLGCLAHYFDTRPPAIYPVILFCAVMAFYLNSFDVRVAFYGGSTGHGQ
jgi:hypothetical protein